MKTGTLNDSGGHLCTFSKGQALCLKGPRVYAYWVLAWGWGAGGGGGMGQNCCESRKNPENKCGCGTGRKLPPRSLPGSLESVRDEPSPQCPHDIFSKSSMRTNALCVSGELSGNGTKCWYLRGAYTGGQYIWMQFPRFLLFTFISLLRNHPC